MQRSYAWFMEMLANDHNAWTTRIQDAFRHHELETLDQQSLEIGVELESSNIFPEVYLRGHALLQWLKSGGLAISDQDKSLKVAVEEFLDDLLSITVPNDDKALWEELALSIKMAIKRSKAGTDAGILRQWLERAENVPSGDGEGWFMNLQGLSQKTRESLVKEIAEGSRVLEAADIPWQARWCHAHNGNGKDVVNGKHLFLKAAEEYLLRVGNPDKLKVLGTGHKPSKSGTRIQSIDAKEHSTAWGEERQGALAKMSGQPEEESLFAIPLRDQTIDSLMSLSFMSVPAPEGKNKDGLSEFFKGEWNAEGCESKRIQSDYLLGRYDRYALEQAPDTSSMACNFYMEDSKPRLYPPYSTRRKLVMRVGGEDVHAPLLVMLVELKASMFRMLFLRWLYKFIADSSANPSIEIFLSYGWEDVVLFVGGDAVSKAHFDLIREIYDHKMVNRTESLFTDHATINAPKGPDIKMTFNIQVKANRKKAFESGMNDLLNKDISQIGMVHTTGRMDYHVWAEGSGDNWGAAKVLRDKLLEMPPVSRIESDIKQQLLGSNH